MSKKPEREGIYGLFTDACKAKGTNLSRVLKECGRSDGNTGSWKTGSYPRLDVVMDIAEYLGMSLDELSYGLESAASVILSDNEREWLSIIRNIPADRQELCKDFLRTHAVVPEKYSDIEKRA